MIEPEFWVGKTLVMNWDLAVIKNRAGSRAKVLSWEEDVDGEFNFEVQFEDGEHVACVWSGYFVFPTALELLAEIAE